MIISRQTIHPDFSTRYIDEVIEVVIIVLPDPDLREPETRWRPPSWAAARRGWISRARLALWMRSVHSRFLWTIAARGLRSGHILSMHIEVSYLIQPASPVRCPYPIWWLIVDISSSHWLSKVSNHTETQLRSIVSPLEWMSSLGVMDQENLTSSPPSDFYLTINTAHWRGKTDKVSYTRAPTIIQLFPLSLKLCLTTRTKGSRPERIKSS